MERLKFGWVKPNWKDIYHYIDDFHHIVTGDIVSICNRYSIHTMYAKNKNFLEKFEIFDTSTICVTCELKLQQRNQNNSKKEILTEINNMSVSDGYILEKAICSQKNCDKKGIAFISINNPKEEHYCIKHNLRVQETIKKLGIISQ